MLLKIDGWRGAGKSVLHTLLDGHKDLFCVPMHDKSFEAFTRSKIDPGWLEHKDTKTLRQLLSKTNYYNLELDSLNGFNTFDFSSEDRLLIPFAFDFYKFERHFISNLIKMETWSVEKIVDQLYESMRVTYKQGGEKTKFYVSQGHPDYLCNINYEKLFPNGKSIQVRRSVESILATVCSRKPAEKDYRGYLSRLKTFKDRIREGEVEKIMKFYSTYEELEKRYPDRFYSVEFKDLVENTEETMKKVAKFLNIDFDPILTIASRDGKELICNGKKYVGKVYDDPGELLTKKERRIIEFHKSFYHLHKQDFNPLGIGLFYGMTNKIKRVVYKK
jgi:hypothetical protein